MNRKEGILSLQNRGVRPRRGNGIGSKCALAFMAVSGTQSLLREAG